MIFEAGLVHDSYLLPGEALQADGDARKIEFPEYVVISVPNLSRRYQGHFFRLG